MKELGLLNEVVPKIIRMDYVSLRFFRTVGSFFRRKIVISGCSFSTDPEKLDGWVESVCLKRVRLCPVMVW